MVGSPTSSDYLFEPPEFLDQRFAGAIGPGAIAILLVSMGLLLYSIQGRPFGRAGLLATLLLLLAALMVAASYRVLTARVSGANIGGGLIMLTGPPVMLGLLAGTGINLRREYRPDSASTVQL